MELGLDNALANASPFAMETEACKRPVEGPAAEVGECAEVDTEAEPAGNGVDNGLDNSDSDSEDLGPETAVDADDVDADKHHEPAPPTPPAHAVVEEGHVDGALVDNVAESGDDSEDEWNYFKGEGEREDHNPSEEQDEPPRSETPCQDNSAWESSSVDMNSSPLNPDAPVFVPGTAAGADMLLAESPRKPLPMDDIEMPDDAQFQTEAIVRPAELLDLDNCDQLNGHHNVSIDDTVKEHLNGNDKCNMDSLGFGFNVGIEPEKVKDSGFIQDFERIQKDTTDFCNIQVFQSHTETNPFSVEGDDELFERLKNKERDPMSMSFYQEKDDDTCDRLPKNTHVDLNAVQPLPDSDDEDGQTNGFCETIENDKENVNPVRTDLFGVERDVQEPNNDIMRFDDMSADQLTANNPNFGQGDNFVDYYATNINNLQNYSNIEFESCVISQETVLQTDTPESHKLLFEQIPEIPDGKSSELGFTHDDMLPSEIEKDLSAIPPQEDSQFIDEDNKIEDLQIESLSTEQREENVETEPLVQPDTAPIESVESKEFVFTLDSAVPDSQRAPSTEQLPISPAPPKESSKLEDSMSPEPTHDVQENIVVDVHEQSEPYHTSLTDELTPQPYDRDLLASLDLRHVDDMEEDRLTPEVAAIELANELCQPAESPLPTRSPLPQEASLPSESPLPATSPLPKESLQTESPLPTESPLLAKSPAPREASLPRDSPLPTNESLLPSESPLLRASPLPAESAQTTESPVLSDSHIANDTLLASASPVPRESPLVSESPLPRESPLPKEVLEPSESPLPRASPLPAEVPLPQESPLPPVASPQLLAASPQPFSASPQPPAASPQPVAASPEPLAASPQLLAASPQPLESSPQPPAASPLPVEFDSGVVPEASDLKFDEKPLEAPVELRIPTPVAAETVHTEVSQSRLTPEPVVEVESAMEATETTAGPTPDIVPEARVELVTDIDIGIPESRAQEICVPVSSEIPTDDTAPPAPAAHEAPLAVAAADVAAAAAITAAVATAAVATTAAKTKTPAKKSPTTPTAKPTPKTAPKTPATQKTPTTTTPRRTAPSTPTAAKPSTTAAPRPTSARTPTSAPKAAPAPRPATATRSPATKPAPAATKPAPRPTQPRAVPAARPAPKAPAPAVPKAAAPKPTTAAPKPATAAPKPASTTARPAPRPAATAATTAAKPRPKAPEKKPLTNGDVKDAKPAAPKPAARPVPARVPPRPAATRAPAAPPAKAVPRAAPRAALDKQSKDLANKRITAKAAPPRTLTAKSVPAKTGVAAKAPPSPDGALLPDVIA